MSAVVAFIGRVMLAALFIMSGLGKLGDIAGTDTYIQSVGLPAGLGLPAAVFEIVAGLAIALGIFTRFFALLLAGFCLVTAMMFHTNFGDKMQAINFMKNIALAGGFLVLFAQRHMTWSYDMMRERRAADAATRAAELRAERAEGRVEGVREGITPVTDVRAPVTEVRTPVTEVHPVNEVHTPVAEVRTPIHDVRTPTDEI